MTWEEAEKLAEQTLEGLVGYTSELDLVRVHDQMSLSRVLLATYQRGVLQNELRIKPEVAQ